MKRWDHLGGAKEDVRTVESLEPTHIFRTRLPEGLPDSSKYEQTDDPTELKRVSFDSAHTQGGIPEFLFKLHPEAGEAEVADIIKRFKHVTQRGRGSSLTRGAVPFILKEGYKDPVKGSIVIETMLQKEAPKIDLERNLVTVQPGLNIIDLQKELKRHGRYYPPGPTYEEATIGGTAATNAAGPQTIGFGQTREWIERIKVVLANGEILDIRRGQYIANDEGYFEMIDSTGKTTKIKALNYEMPKVAKISAGYPPSRDLLDYFVGSEGTLGMIIEATVKCIPLPSISWAVLPCRDEAEAFEITRRLRDVSAMTKASPGSDGLNAISIESIGKNAIPLIKNNKCVLKEPAIAKAGSVLILQLAAPIKEGENADEVSKRAYAQLVGELGNVGNDWDERLNLFATPSQEDVIEDIKGMRSKVPEIVNALVANNKEAEGLDSRIVKMAGDFVVPIDLLPDMIEMLERVITGKYGLKYYIWGHHSDGNLHPNIICESSAQVEIAEKALHECAEEVIKLGGCVCAEHGAGRKKRDLMEMQYPPETGVLDQMREFRFAFDPQVKFPSNIFTPKVAEA